MDRNTSTKAIVLNSRRSGDCDRRLSLLSEDLGLIEVTSYGARKGRKSGMAEICAEGTFFLYFNPVRQQYSLKDLLLESAHETLRDRKSVV